MRVSILAEGCLVLLLLRMRVVMIIPIGNATRVNCSLIKCCVVNPKCEPHHAAAGGRPVDAPVPFKGYIFCFY